jgi:hypothetical protein
MWHNAVLAEMLYTDQQPVQENPECKPFIIHPGGSIRRHERTMIKVVDLEGAC